MRYKAMHDYTGKLPLIKNSYPTKLIGDSTVNSMMSGVMNGIKYEIEGMIQAYQQEYKDLVIFVTGGDAKAIEINTTSTLFYDEDLTINGLYKILHYQHAY
jgi:type III pantothenate kinase